MELQRSGKLALFDDIFIHGRRMIKRHILLTALNHRLVATLGHKSALKKVDRRAINNVNVPKACEIIIEPEAPMALRLQSNLL